MNQVINYLLVKVTKKMVEAQDIATFELSDIGGKPLPPFSAGSHIDVRIKDGLVRQYSLCNHPSENHRYIIGVLRDPKSRGGSTAMHDDVEEGQILQISIPKNHFPLVRAERSLLFAGGIGITPILSMAERLTHAGEDFELHYCTRNPESTAFKDRIASSVLANKTKFHFDNGGPEQRLNLDILIATPQHGTHMYICGPSGFIEYVTQTAKHYGWESEQIHREYFTAPVESVTSKGDFSVKVASSGKIYVIPANKTIVDVLREDGISIPVSCEQGVCGTCVTRVLEGEPDHKDLFLTDEEHAKNNMMTPCCSRANGGTLILDL